MKTKQYIIFKQEREKRSKWIYWVFFGIIAVIMVFVPFFAPNLRYSVGNLMWKIFTIIGAFCILFGGLSIIAGIAGLYLKSRGWPKAFLIGVLLLWIGFYCTGTTFKIFGFILGNPAPPQGYY